jgi:hypothetical protein
LWGKLLETDAAQVLAGAEFDEDLVKCAHCGTPWTFDGFGLMKCPECGFETCSICGCPWHEGACSRLDRSHAVEEEATANLVVTCKCGTQFVREVGCNLLTCPMCNTKVCDFCHETIPSELAYDHFWSRVGEVCPPGQCPLWTGVADEKERRAAVHH